MNKKSLGLTFALMLTAIPVFAQGNDQVMVRLIHAVPSAPDVSVSVGATQLFDNVAFNKVTAFKSMPEQDDKTVTIKLADGRQLKTTEKLDFDDADEQYTILVTPDDSGANPKVVVLKDDVEDVDQDEVEVTLINASPAQKAIKLILNDDTKANGVNYAEADDNDVKPGAYTIKVVNADGVDQTIATKSATLVGGTAVTVLVTGQNSVQIINNAAPETDLGATGAAGMNSDMGTTTGTGTHMMSPGTSMGAHMMPGSAPTPHMNSMMTSAPDSM